MRLGLLVAAASILVAPVLAQDLRDGFSVRVADPAFDWGGFYAGVHAGYGAGDVISRSLAGEMPLRGALLGVTLGANWQVEQFVLGVEGDMAWSGIGGQGECRGGAGAACMGALGWLGAVKARAGLAMDRSLLFVTGGVALAGLRGTLQPVAADHAWGWTIGVGSEVIVSEAMSLRAEYGLVSFRSGGSLGPGTIIRPSIHVARLGVIWHF